MTTPPEGFRMSRRESEVLDLMAQGASNKRIAKELHISLGTVKVHVSAIFDKLGISKRDPENGITSSQINSRVLAVVKAIKLGLVKLWDWYN